MRYLVITALLAAACGSSKPSNDDGGPDVVDAPQVDGASDALVATDAAPDATTDALVLSDAAADAVVTSDAAPDAQVLADAGADATIMADAKPDAPVDAKPDAAPDAMPDAAPDAPLNGRGLVKVHLVDKNSAPLAGLHVVFIDTDATVTDVVSDASGLAQANVFNGASVTAVRARDGGGAYSLATVQSLAIGDDITLISAAGGASSNEDPFTVRAVPLPSADVATATKTGSTGTYTTLAPHGLAVGDKVTVAGVLLSGYNGTFTVASVPTTTSFTANIGTGGLADSTGGTAVKGIPYTVMFPSYAGATSYQVVTPCGPVDVGTSTSPTVLLRAGCTVSPMDLIVYAKSSSTVELAYVQATNVTFTAGGTTMITDTWHALSTVAATFTNPTTRVNELTVDRYTPYVRGISQVSASATNLGSSTTLNLSTSSPANAWMRTNLRCPSGSGAGCLSSAIGVAQQTVSAKVNGTATTYSLDIGANLLPWVNAVYDPPTTTINVTVTGTGTYDLFEANLRYVRGQTIYTWRVFGPTAQSITFPALPSTLPGDPTVRPTDTQSAYQVYVCDSDAIADYRAAIANPFRSLGTCETSAAVSTRPSGLGTLNRLSQWN